MTMNSENTIVEAQLVIDLLLKHDENCRNCCLHDIFKQIEKSKNVEGQIPNVDPLTKSTSSIGDPDVF